MASQGRIESEIVIVALGGPREPPVDLIQIAREMRVGDIRPTNFRSGFTDFSSAAPVIYLNNVQLDTTKRFVFAHELAHVMLRMSDVVRLIHMQGRANLLADEEVLADGIAATILVPDSWIDALRKTRCSYKQFRDIARLANIR